MPFNSNNNNFPCTNCNERTSNCHAGCYRYQNARAEAKKGVDFVKSQKKGRNEATSVLVESRLRLKKRL